MAQANIQMSALPRRIIVRRGAAHSRVLLQALQTLFLQLGGDNQLFTGALGYAEGGRRNPVGYRHAPFR